MKFKHFLYKATAFVAIILCVTCSPDPPEDLKVLKVATLNCAFLWDGIDPEEGNPAVTFPHKGNPELAKQHMSKIASIVREINADIINLVEVEGYDALKLFNDSFLTGLGYHIGFVKGKDTYTGQDVALLSKLPIDSIWRYDQKGKSGDFEKSVSKNYAAAFTVNGFNLTVIGLHFIARPTDLSRLHERQAQADAILTHALELYNQGFKLIIMGDFNDYDGDPCCIDMNQNLPVTHVLARIKQMDADNPNDDLVNVIGFVPLHKRYTVHWDKDGEGDVDQDELSAIDHILLSPELIIGGIKADVLHLYNPLEVTDHFPVVAEIALEDLTLLLN